LIAAVKRIGPRVSINADTLLGWCKQSDVDADRASGQTTTDAAKSRSSSGRTASSSEPMRACLRPGVSSRGSSTRDCLVVAFIGASADRRSADGLPWGVVEPICRVLNQLMAVPVVVFWALVTWP
jgi:hypothetical protein